MSNITFTLDFTGTPNSFDREAAIFAIERANSGRETPLPYSTGAELRASYLTVLLEGVESTHAAYQKAAAQEAQESAAERWRISSDTQRALALAQLEPLP
jgi:hypothetical protein